MNPQDSQNDPIIGDDDNAEFDAVFDELAGDSPEPDEGKGQDEGGEVDDKDDEPSSPGTNDVGANDPSAQDETAPAGTTPEQDDIWAKLPDDVRREVEAIRTQNMRLRGQISARDRQLAEISRAQQQQQGDDEGEKKADIKDLLESERLKQLREDYPEFEPLLEVLGGLTEEVTTIKGNVVQTEDREFEQLLEEQTSILEKDHPDWMEYAKPDPKFSDWLATQPRHVREAAQRNAEYIFDASEVSDVLSRYKDHLGVSQRGNDGNPDPKPDARRQAQKDGARSIRANYPAAAAGIPDDYDAAFDLLAAQEDRRIAAKGNRRA